MEKTVNYLRVWDNASCGNTYVQFFDDCQKRGYMSVQAFPEHGKPRVAIAAETREILENSFVYNQLSKMDFT